MKETFVSKNYFQKELWYSKLTKNSETIFLSLISLIAPSISMKNLKQISLKLKSCFNENRNRNKVREIKIEERVWKNFPTVFWTKKLSYHFISWSEKWGTNKSWLFCCCKEFFRQLSLQRAWKSFWGQKKRVQKIWKWKPCLFVILRKIRIWWIKFVLSSLFPPFEDLSCEKFQRNSDSHF